MRVYFRRVEVAGIENVPRKSPVIFVLNHPNALVDPAFLLSLAPRRVSFLAKSPLFRMPVLGYFVRAMDSLPVYRPQDEGEDVSKNREVFVAARKLLARGGTIGICPEGVSHDEPRLRPIKTGAARIALAAVSTGEVADLKIVPAGLYYTSKTKFRSAVLLYFGKAIEVTPVELEADGNPPRGAVRELSNRIINHPDLVEARAHAGRAKTDLEKRHRLRAYYTMFYDRMRAQAGSPEHDVNQLAKETQNPVGDIISVPFQFNFNNGGGLGDETFFNLNFQPVIPIHLSNSVTVISRTIVPFDSFPGPSGTRFSGVGDIQQQLFFTPAKSGSLIWGIGPVFSFPTATAEPAKTGTWAAGGGAVVLTMPGPWVIGALVSQLSPLTDAGGQPRTNLFTLQYFINYNFGKGWAFGTAPTLTANWDATGNDRWTVPVGLSISRTLVFNRQPMSLGFQYYRNVQGPDSAPSSQLRFTLSLIFPTKPRAK